jgi:hypothetical protein
VNSDERTAAAMAVIARRQRHLEARLNDEIRTRRLHFVLLFVLVMLVLIIAASGCATTEAAQPRVAIELSSLPDQGPIAYVTTPAVRVTVPEVEQPPPLETTTTTLPPAPTGLHGMPFAPAGLSDCAEMYFYRTQAGLPDRFGGPGQTGLGWRESNCRNEDGVHTSCCHGYWQMHRQHFNGSGFVYGKDCQAYSFRDVNSDDPLEKQKQACAAKALYDEAGISPWALP